MNEATIEALATVLLKRRGENILGQHDLEEARSLAQDLERAGYILVATQPTDDMIDRGGREFWKKLPDAPLDAEREVILMKEIYRAMTGNEEGEG